MPAFDSSLGALEIGATVSAVLFGMLVLQIYIYYSNFPADPLHIKLQVAFVWLCELGNAFSIAHAFYIISITYFGNPQAPVIPPSSLPAGMIFASLIIATVQAYFALRLYRLSKKPFIPVFCICVSMLSCVALLIVAVGGIKLARSGQFVRFVDDWKWLLIVTFLSRLVNDILITVTSVAYLFSRRDTAYSSTFFMLERLIKWTLETGLVTAVSGVLILVSFVTMRHNDIWLAVHIVVSRLYANSYLAALNNRLVLRKVKDSDVLGHAPSASQNNRTPIQIELTRTVVTDPGATAGKNHNMDDQAVEIC